MKSKKEKQQRISYKYRIYPTVQQRQLIDRDLELCRLVYNWALEESIKYYKETGKTLRAYTIQTMLTKKKKKEEKYKLPYSQCLTETVLRLDKAYQNFFRRVKAGEKPGFPRFKSYGFYTSMTRQSQKQEIITSNSFEFSSKIGSVETLFHRQLPEGTIKTITISRDGHKYFVIFSLVVKPFPEPKKVTKPMRCTINFGDEFLYKAGGRRVRKPRIYKKFEKNIAQLNRRLDKVKYLPFNHPRKTKVRRALHKVYFRIKNLRRQYIRNEVIKLVKEGYNEFVVEKLEIREKVEGNRDKEENKSILDTKYYDFVQFLKWECEKRGLSFRQT